MNLSKIKRGVRNPISSLNYLGMLLKAHCYKAKYRIMNKNVRIGKHFKVVGKLSVRGPGRVVIGDNVLVDGSMHAVTPWTYDPNASIMIGSNVFLNGTRFGCSKRIEVGDNSILADCRIMDTDFHSILPDRRNDPDYIKSAPVKIGKNVWIGLGCVILRGVAIGDNAAVSALSVVHDDVPEWSCFGGNPAVLIKTIPRGKE